MNAQQSEQAWKDDVAERLAAYAIADFAFEPGLLLGAKRILIDTLAVGLGAFDHPAAKSARQYLSFFDHSVNGAVIWGTQLRAAADKATLVNGVLLRCYDYNDVMIGKKGAGHPSDMIAALLAFCDWQDISGQALLEALVVGYEIAEALHDITPAEAAGWDHANVSALGAACAIGRLLRLSHSQMCEALGISAVQHVQSNEIESSALNQRGDLTMWKRFHGADAMRHALDACLLAASGAEGPVRPFRGTFGFLNIFGVSDDPATYLAERLRPGHAAGAVHRTNFKRWPVGSRAQSAIASTLDARLKSGGAPLASIHVRAEPGVYEHLVAIRQNPWRPVSRETADHSLPYIVGAAALDGFIDIGSFDLAKVNDAERASFIADCITIEPVDAIPGATSARGWHLSEVTLTTQNGQSFTGLVRPGPGHQDNPFTDKDLHEKLQDNAGPLIGQMKTTALFELMQQLEKIKVRNLTNALARP